MSFTGTTHRLVGVAIVAGMILTASSTAALARPGGGRRAHLEIIEETTPGMSATFTGGGGDFTLTAPNRGWDSRRFAVARGETIVIQQLTAGVSLTSIQCTGAASYTTDLLSGTVTLEIGGLQGTCTFSN